MERPPRLALKGFLSFVIFLVLFSVSPMISEDYGCFGNGDPNFGCLPQTSRRVVFPVYRTIICELWSKPSCAPDTLLPGWYDHLMNYKNAVILIGLAALSIFASQRLTRKWLG